MPIIYKIGAAIAGALGLLLAVFKLGSAKAETKAAKEINEQRENAVEAAHEAEEIANEEIAKAKPAIVKRNYFGVRKD